MNDPAMLGRLLIVAALMLTAISWLSTAILLRHAWHRPRLGVLRERALLAVLISVVGTLSVLALALVNTDASETVRNALRIALLGLLAVPSYWTWLYYTGRLGEDE